VKVVTRDSIREVLRVEPFPVTVPWVPPIRRNIYPKIKYAR
jgi:hypothetical protein